MKVTGSWYPPREQSNVVATWGKHHLPRLNYIVAVLQAMVTISSKREVLFKTVQCMSDIMEARKSCFNLLVVAEGLPTVLPSDDAYHHVRVDSMPTH